MNRFCSIFAADYFKCNAKVRTSSESSKCFCKEMEKNLQTKTKLMTDKEKLIALMEKFAGGNQQAFAQLIGVSRNNIATWIHRNSITANGREAILDAFPQVSREWLQDGIERRGEKRTFARTSMLAEQPSTIHFSRHELVPLFEDCRASCGVVEQFEHPEQATEYIHVPGVKALAAIPAEGESMEPTIHEGDYCLIGDSVQLADVNSRTIYLVVTTEGHCMFKRIYDEGREAKNILVLSENPDYTPHAQPIAKSDVLRVYPLEYVLHKVSED